MRVIKHGIRGFMLDPFHKVEFHCGCCGCIFEFEKADVAKMHNSKNLYRLFCPECGFSHILTFEVNKDE